MQAEINTWVVLSVALPGMTSDPNVMLPAASVGMLLAIGTAGLTVSPHSTSPVCYCDSYTATCLLHLGPYFMHIPLDGNVTRHSDVRLLPCKAQQVCVSLQSLHQAFPLIWPSLLPPWALGVPTNIAHN